MGITTRWVGPGVGGLVGERYAERHGSLLSENSNLLGSGLSINKQQLIFCCDFCLSESVLTQKSMKRVGGVEVPR